MASSELSVSMNELRVGINLRDGGSLGDTEGSTAEVDDMLYVFITT